MKQNEKLVGKLEKKNYIEPEIIIIEMNKTDKMFCDGSIEPMINAGDFK